MRSGPRSSSRSRGKRRPRCAPAEATPVPDGGARLGAYARGSHCRRGGDDSRRCWFPETTVDEQLAILLRGFHASSTCASVCGRFFVKVFCAKAAALPSARHTPAATMAEQGKQDIVRKLIHIFLDVPHDIFVNFTRSIEEGTRHRERTRENPIHRRTHVRVFPFGTREPIPGRVSESRFSIRHPLGFKRALRRSRLPVHHRSRAKTPLVTPQPPARPRSSSGSASSASCSWFLSCTKR